MATLGPTRGRVGYFETFGSVDPQSGRPMPLDAIFRIYGRWPAFLRAWRGS